MNELVKILVNECGEKDKHAKWHLVVDETVSKGNTNTACTGECFGEEVSGIKYKLKWAEKGITCSDCKDVVKWFKSVKI